VLNEQINRTQTQLTCPRDRITARSPVEFNQESASLLRTVTSLGGKFGFALS
jgi:hypothetical protein